MTALAVTAALVFVYSLLEPRVRQSPLSGPLLFLLAGLAMSPEALGWFTLELDGDVIDILLKATLVILLFTEGSKLRARRVGLEARFPARLLVAAMPLVMAGGLGLGLWLLGGLGFWEAATLSAILAPTDAALSLPVVTNKRVPGVIRRSLEVEAGLNDGLSVPFAFGFAAAAAVAQKSMERSTFLEFLFDQIVLGSVVGIAVGWVGAKLINAIPDDEGAASRWGEIAFLALAGVSFASAEAIDGNGFIAAWVAGLTFARIITPGLPLDRFADRVGALLTLASFLVFGALLLPSGLESLDMATVAFVLVTLFVIRPVAVALSMIGTGLRAPSVAFLGWFGPRGLASVILISLVAKEYELLGIEEMGDVVIVTIAASAVLHGLTAAVGSNAYASWYERSRPEALTRYEPSSQGDLHEANPEEQGST